LVNAGERFATASHAVEERAKRILQNGANP